MYSPKFNLIADRAILIEAMQAYSFAILFGPQSDLETPARLVATHLPLVVKDEGEHGLLEGHFAKVNSHWQSLANREALVVFHGPHSYVSPTLYLDPLSVPTWNYIAVHAIGTVTLIEDESAKDALLADLILAHEPDYAAKWRAMPPAFRKGMLGGIVGFRIVISQIQGKFKISQNRTLLERRNVQIAHSFGTPDQQALAAWMARLVG